MKLSVKFGLVIFLLLALAFGLNAWLFVRGQDESLRLQQEAIDVTQEAVQKEALHRALIVLNLGESCREYARERLAKAIEANNEALLRRAREQQDLAGVMKVVEQHSKSLVFEGQSATFLARGVFESLRKRLPEYSFREAALNPLNLENRADPEEEKIIRRLQGKETQVSGFRVKDGHEQFFVARPIRVEAVCLRCHEKPDTAPPELIERYGKDHGFGWKLGEINSAFIIAVPADDVRQQVLAGSAQAERIYHQQANTTRRLLVVFGIGGVLLLALIYVLFEWLVNRRIRRAAAVMGRVADRPGTEARLDDSSADELGAMAVAFNRMADALRQAQLRKEEQVNELDQARTEALRASRAKSTFLANMSHELRTPLNAILGYSEMLTEEAAEDGRTQSVADLQKIQAAGRHLLALINDILDLSKIEAGKMDLHPETFDLHALVQEVASTVQPLAEKNGNELLVESGPHLGSVRLDPVKLRQTLLNLLSNACKFTEQGRITLTVARAPRQGRDFLTFAVRDTGIGISREQMGRLFQTFTQADNAAVRKHGGTGLGLALSRLLCRMMGGDITAESEPGRGSCFTATLPAMLDTPSAAAAAPAAAAQGSRTVLVIDDDPTVHDLMCRFLDGQGFRVVGATNGPDGLRLARELRPDAITLDVIMPGMDGWAVLTALKGDPELADVPVIMLSMVDDQTLGYALGAADYLLKPLDRTRLLGVLRRYAAGGTALVVEDDAPTRELLQRLLAGHGWSVAEAADGRAALAHLERAVPQVVLLDLMLPEMDGFEFLHRLRQRPEWQDVPVVVLTAKDLTPADRERLNGHVARVFQKCSYSRDELLSVVARLLAPRRRPATAAP
jgi:signal transduction histidine kinase/CheY-like chemotaxis protein